MYSITKIGKIALTRALGRKEFLGYENRRVVTKVLFPKASADLKMVSAEDGHNVWSIELGIIPISPKKDQTLFDSIVETLIALEKDYVPTHYFHTNSVVSKDRKLRERTHIVSRLDERDEFVIFEEHVEDASFDRFEKKMEEDQLAFEKEEVEILENLDGWIYDNMTEEEKRREDEDLEYFNKENERLQREREMDDELDRLHPDVHGCESFEEDD